MSLVKTLVKGEKNDTVIVSGMAPIWPTLPSLVAFRGNQRVVSTDKVPRERSLARDSTHQQLDLRNLVMMSQALRTR